MFSDLFVILSFISTFCPNTVGHFLNSTNSSGSLHEELLRMIHKQQELCPYVPLCTTTNISTDFVKISDNRLPCCTPCSCEKSCIENDTCCPDFPNLLQEPKERSTESSDYIQCVKVQYGPMNNNSGYKMIADCPKHYTNQTTITRCKANFDFLKAGTLTDHIPIFERISGQSYKNKYCYLCNSNSTMTAQFWNLMLNCTGRVPTFPSSPQSPLELVEKLLDTRKCNVIFQINTRAKNIVNVSLEECHNYSIVSSCKPEYVGTDADKLCQKYVWPVKRNRWVGYRLYKNYACMLCNDVPFDERCHEVKLYTFYAVSLMEDHSDVISSGDSSDSDAHAQSDIGQTNIDRLFPDSLGNVVCPKGFIFYSRKKMCRQVLCPYNFFVRNGECVPLFDVFSGVGYMSQLEIVYPPTFNGLKTADFEQAVLSAIDQRIRRYIANDDCMFSLWSDHQVPGNMDLSRKYCLLVYIKGQDNYSSFISFLYWFVVLGREIQVYVKGQTSVEKYIDLRFSDVSQVNGEPLGSRGEKFYLIQPKSWITKLIEEEKTIPFVTASKSVFCYRVALNHSEVEYKRRAVFVLETQKILTYPTVQRDKSAAFTCVEDAFDGIPNFSKYIFSNDDTTKKQIPKSGNVDKNFIHNEKQNTQDPTDLLSKSLFTTAATAGFVVLVIVIKKCLRKFTRMNQEPYPENHRLSNLRVRTNSQSCIENRQESKQNIENKRDGKRNKVAVEPDEKNIKNRREGNQNKDVTESQELNIENKQGDELNKDVTELHELTIENRQEGNRGRDATESKELNIENKQIGKRSKDATESHALNIEDRREVNQTKGMTELKEMNIENTSRRESNKTKDVTESQGLNLEYRRKCNQNEYVTESHRLNIEKGQEGNQNKDVTESQELNIVNKWKEKRNKDMKQPLKLNIENRPEGNQNDYMTEPRELNIENRQEDTHNKDVRESQELYIENKWEDKRNKDMTEPHEQNIENRLEDNQNEYMTESHEMNIENKQIGKRNKDMTEPHELNFENRQEGNQNEYMTEPHELNIEYRRESNQINI